MSKKYSTTPAASGKPAKPRPDFPLFPHAAGVWAKKIKGKLHYFGPWDDPDGALAKYEQQKADLHAGRLPREEPEELTVYWLCAKFLTAKKEQRDNGELAARTYLEYEALCQRLIKTFGRQRLVSDLRPDDFAKLRRAMARTWGPVRLAAEIVRTKTPFHWAWKSGLIHRPMVYGEGFKRPSRKTIRKHKAEQGPRMFEASEIRRMFDSATQPLKSMILLGVNCGYSNSDIAALPVKALDLQTGWVTFARVKTGIMRKCPLWPETVAALAHWLTVRPEPEEESHRELVFITSAGGSWGKTADRPLSKEVRKLLDRLGIDGGRTFYHLRHTLQTVGDESGDFLAVRHIMGHASNDIADVYRERVSNERLRKVTEHVRAWLFGTVQ